MISGRKNNLPTLCEKVQSCMLRAEYQEGISCLIFFEISCGAVTMLSDGKNGPSCLVFLLAGLRVKRNGCAIIPKEKTLNL